MPESAQRQLLQSSVERRSLRAALSAWRRMLASRRALNQTELLILCARHELDYVLPRL